MRGELEREVDRGIDAAGVRRARLRSIGREIERRAVVDRRANERQSERYVHATPEGGRLERGQALVVVHGDDRIVAARVVRYEDRVRGNRPRDVVARDARGRDGGRYDVDFLAAEVTAFAGMRVESAYGDARRRDGEIPGERRRENLDRPDDRIARDRSSDVREREMGGDKRDAQSAADQEHDHA